MVLRCEMGAYLHKRVFLKGTSILVSSVLVAHVSFTTVGYVGLIAANVWLLKLCGQQDIGAVLEAVSTWRGTAQIFGPMLGVGALLGFWLAALLHQQLGSRWLLLTYGLIVLALGTQAAIMIPWQARATEVVSQGALVSRRPIAIVLSVLSAAYVSIAGLMLIRP
jgi:hypothetical protein